MTDLEGKRRSSGNSMSEDLGLRSVSFTAIYFNQRVEKRLKGEPSSEDILVRYRLSSGCSEAELIIYCFHQGQRGACWRAGDIWWKGEALEETYRHKHMIEAAVANLDLLDVTVSAAVVEVSSGAQGRTPSLEASLAQMVMHVCVLRSGDRENCKGMISSQRLPSSRTPCRWTLWARGLGCSRGDEYLPPGLVGRWMHPANLGLWEFTSLGGTTSMGYESPWPRLRGALQRAT
jgi:hypothetical protein